MAVHKEAVQELEIEEIASSYPPPFGHLLNREDFVRLNYIGIGNCPKQGADANRHRGLTTFPNTHFFEFLHSLRRVGAR